MKREKRNYFDDFPNQFDWETRKTIGKIGAQPDSTPFIPSAVGANQFKARQQFSKFFFQFSPLFKYYFIENWIFCLVFFYIFLSLFSPLSCLHRKFKDRGKQKIIIEKAKPTNFIVISTLDLCFSLSTAIIEISRRHSFADTRENGWNECVEKQSLCDENPGLVFLFSFKTINFLLWNLYNVWVFIFHFVCQKNTQRKLE